MMRRCAPTYKAPFEKIDMMVVVSDRVHTGMTAEAVVKLRMNGEVVHTAAEGGGPVHALDQALRKALLPAYPQLQEVRLADYKVRILDPDQATDATTRVVIEAACGEERWSTVGCSQNIIEASCQALMDALELFLLRQEERSVPSNAATKRSVPSNAATKRSVPQTLPQTERSFKRCHKNGKSERTLRQSRRL